MGSPYTIDVGPLLGPARRSLAVDTQVDVPDFDDCSFPKPAHVVLDLRAADRGVRIDGSIDLEAVAACGRCLDEVRLPVHVEVDERVAPDDSDPLAESNVLEGERLNLSDLVRQLTASALPMSVVCTEECRGLCPECGRNRNDGTCECPATRGDDGKPEMEDPEIQDP